MKKFIVTFLLCCFASLGNQSLFAEEKIDYIKQVKHLLSEKCYACHSALKQEAELRLETKSLMLKGGDSGAALVPGHPEKSLILERIIAADDEQMPPPGEGSKLTAKEVALLKQWIQQGAIAPQEESPGSPRDHWAFQPPRKIKLIPVDQSHKKQNPIDQILAAQRSDKKLVPVSPASKRILLRRVYLDIIGLPPTRKELHAFLKDNSKDAYRKVVIKLLASPQYGERWGRHWMDIWRYTDWYGLGKQVRNSQKHIWHWRDWIIESLNQDKSYGLMIEEMLAADEMAPTDRDRLRATGFLARQYYLFNRTTWLDSVLEHTSKAFLGLTMNCSKCHDHKYDPISQVDYYRMRAIFEPYQVRLDALPGETNLEKDGLPRIFDAHADATTYLHIRGNPKTPDKETKITPGIPALFTFHPMQISNVTLPIEAHRPALRAYVLKDQLKVATNQIQIAQTNLSKANELLVKIPQKKRVITKKTTEENLRPFLMDQFTKENAAIWKFGSGKWRYADGRLTQSQIGYARAYLRSLKNHPKNFKVKLRFKTTGGEKWKSVGIAFDVIDNREKMIYASSVSGGSKIQISYKTGTKQIYPPGAGKRCEVSLNKIHELELAVRDQLINVTLNGQHSIAYHLPIKRELGKLDIIAFDAAVEFLSIEVTPLSKTDKLQTTKETKPLNYKTAKIALQIAEKKLAAAKLYPLVLKTAFAADVEKYQSTSAKNIDSLSKKAALAVRKYELAQAEESYLVAQQKFAAAKDDKTKKVIEKEITKTKSAIKKAEQALQKPGHKYTSLRASRKALEGPAEKDASRYQPYPKTSTGRRTAFARWITHRKNPLTARVAVNHIWLRHFGQPLEEDVTDFGLRSKRPPQQKLLDWLAVELMEHDWSMKHLHQLIVTSKTYQLSSTTLKADQSTMKIDPDNHFYWRRKPIRMESEVIRDSLLHLANSLDLTLGGPTIDPNKKTKTNRRSLYFTVSRDHKNKFTSMFDAADILNCYRRDASVIPQQALTLANSKLALSMARKITSDLQKEMADASDEEFITTAFETILSVKPTKPEVTFCLKSMKQIKAIVSKNNKINTNLRVRENLVHALINHNDFITIR